MKTTHLYSKVLMAAALIITVSCQKDEAEPEEEQPTIIETSISGVVQKGPFNVGTTVTMSELNENFSQTGKIFVTQINSNDGSFELKDVQLSTPFVELKADGFYFDEVKGENSAARLSLNAIADVTDRNTLNINVLTHLEKPRVEYLLTNGYTLEEAKAKAKQEVLNILHFQNTGADPSETLDFTKPGVENSFLLALSAVVQGYRSVADVSELLTYIANDLKEDGTLDNSDLQTELISHALFIDTAKITENLANQYNGTGAAIQVGDFGKYFDQFINKTTYTPENLIDYPEQTSKGLNILNENNSTFDSGIKSSYSMAARTVPGIPLRIKLTVIEGNIESFSAWGYRADQINWEITNYNNANHTQIFTVVNEDELANLEIIFGEGNFKIEVKYIEGTRERTRIITIN